MKLSIRLEKLIDQQNRMTEAISPVIKMQEQMTKAVNPIIELQEQMIESMKPILEINKKLKDLLDPLINIEWKELSDRVAKRVIHIDQQLKKYEKLLWCLDIETLAVLEEKQIKTEGLSNYVKENLPVYIEGILSDPMFSLHSSLIQETYSAYNAGYYKLCIFPLFATFEHIINSWFDGNIQQESILITKKPQGRRYYNKINKLVDNDKDSDLKAFIQVYTFTILRIYLKTFKAFGDELNSQLNRHSVVHGFHDYDSITETDVLKLFQLLKATMILPYVSVEKMNM